MSALIDGVNGWVYSQSEIASLTSLCDDDGFPAEISQAWSHCIIRRSAILGGCSVFFIQAVTPTKPSVFPEFISDSIGYPASCPVVRMLETTAHAGVSRRLIDLSVVLRRNPIKAEFAAPDGTGWEPAAADAAARRLVQALGTVGALQALRQRLDQEVAETLAVLDANPCGRAYLEGTSPVAERGARISYGSRSELIEAGALVIFDDKFLISHHRVVAECLASYFSEIHLIQSREIDFSFLARVGATNVIASVSIDSVASVPSDHWHLDAEEWRYSER